MRFDPLSRDVGYDPEIMEAQRNLEASQQASDYTFSEGFTGKQDLGTDEGRQAWATSGLFGLMLSKLYSDEDQQEWFVQRNAVEFGHRELDNEIEAWRGVGETRDFTKQEHEHIKELMARKTLLEDDLAFVYENLDGNMDATLDKEGKSFNDRWGMDTDEESGFLDLLGLLKDNPAYTGGVISAELLKDLPFLGIAKILGIAHKGMSINNIVAKVNAKLAGIKPKALRGLAQMGTGVGAGAVAGGGYEALYSGLEEGEVKGDDVWMGAKFGGAFGVLGGAGLMYKGAQINKGVVNTAETTAALAAATTAGKGIKAEASDAITKTADNIRKASDEAVDDSSRISSQARETTILPAYKQEIINNAVKGNDIPMYSVYDLEGNIKTYVDRRALQAEHKRVLKELESGTFRGRDTNTLTRRELAGIKNKDSYESMLLAYEKARASIDIERRVKGDEFPPRNLNDLAYDLTREELNRVDAEYRDRVTGNQAKKQEQAEVEQAVGQEEAAIRKQNMEAEGTDVEADVLPPTPPGVMEGVGKVIRDNPKSAMALGAASAYAYADTTENEVFGAVLAAAAMKIGPKVINGKSLKASAMKAKISISKSLESFSANSKILEFQMQVVLKEVAEVFDTPEKGRKLINAIEKNSDEGLTKREIEVKDKVKAQLDIIGKEAVLSGVIKDAGAVATLSFGKFKKGEQGAFLQNYFPHIFDKDIDDDILQELVALYLQSSKSGLQRTMMETIESIAEKYPDKNIITNPVRALELYTQAMTRTIYGKNLINSLFKLNLDMSGRSLPALMTDEVFKSLRKTGKKDGGLTPQEALNYESFDHPSLRGYVAHKDVKPLIDDQFAVLRKGGVGDVMEGILKLNNGLKRLFVFGSLFHAQALLMSAAYALGPSGISKIKAGKVSIKDANGKVIGTRPAEWADLKIGSGAFNELAEQAIKDGLGIIAIKKQELVNPGFKAMEEVLERLGPLGAMGTKAFKNIDYLTWEYFHDRFKLAAYLQKKQRLMDKDGHTDEVAGKLAAEFANDAFGSLDWDNFATKLYTYAAKNPNNLRGKTADTLASVLPINKRRWLNLGLFAPDWTISNIRIVGKTFTTAYKYTEGFLKAFHRGDEAAWKSKQGKELASSFRMYGAYSFRAGVVTSGMWWAMTEAFTDKEPTIDDLQEFWYGETSGKLQLGNGESMVISKQIAEPIHWLQHPAHTLLNKGSIVPKTITEGMFNKQWFSMKKGFPMGPAIVEPDGTYHYPKWILGKAVPIVTKPMFDSKLSWAEKMERTFTGFFGFPQYGNPGKYD